MVAPGYVKVAGQSDQGGDGALILEAGARSAEPLAGVDYWPLA